MRDSKPKGRSNETTTRGLTILYGAALTAVALLTLTGQMVLRHAIEQQSFDLAVVDQLGQQRLLSLMVSRDASELQGAEHPTERAEILGELRTNASLWTVGYHNLQNFSQYPEARTHRVATLLSQLQAKQTPMARTVRSLVLEATRVGATAGPSAFDEYVEKVNEQEPQVVSLLGNMSRGYQDEAAIRGAEAERLEAIFFLAILFVLLAEGLLLLPSAVTGVRRTVGERQRAEIRISQQNTLLADRNAQLESSQGEMERANSTLNEAYTIIQGVSSRYTELFQNLPVACFAFDEEGKIHEWNKACEPVFGRSHESVYFNSMFDTIFVDARVGDVVERVRKALAFGEPAEGVEWPSRRPDGSVAYLLSNIFPLRGSDNSVGGGICTNIDITERKRDEAQIANQLETIERFRAELQQQKLDLEQVNARLRELADTDSLTEVKNRRAFVEMLERQTLLCVRLGLPLSTLLIDVDELKSFNEKFGSHNGDKVLTAVAAVLVATARGSDFVARMEADVFGMILPATDAAGSIALAERVRIAVEQAEWPHSIVTVSIGALTLTEHAAGPPALIADAEAALDGSKRAGRNIVTHFGATDSRAVA